MSEENQTNAPDLGPQRISFPVLLLKVIAGIIGGAIGSLVLLFIFVLASSILEPFINPTEGGYVSPIFIFLMSIMVFISSTIGNIVSVFFLAMTERNKYKKISSTIYQVFILCVIMFILMVPVYFIAAGVGTEITVFAIALHMIISAQVSAMILELVSNHKYSLLGVYGVAFSVIVSAAFMFMLYRLVETPTVLLFAALPALWGSFALIYSIVNMLYGWIVDIYDKDFLATSEKYGDDYGKKVVIEEEAKPKNESGADFLRKG